jgi:predicted RNase H-like nuclease (RuvC/YqgF family)
VEVFPDENEKIPTDNNQDIFKELFLAIKIRAERQQVRISELQKELDRCNAIIDLSASQDKELIELLLSNLELLKKIESISSELEQLRKRNKYLETILEDYEAGDDGDLLLNLTELITNLKEALSALKIKNKEQ